MKILVQKVCRGWRFSEVILIWQVQHHIVTSKAPSQHIEQDSATGWSSCNRVPEMPQAQPQLVASASQVNLDHKHGDLCIKKPVDLQLGDILHNLSSTYNFWWLGTKWFLFKNLC